MVALTAFSVGVTLAMQAAHSLESLGAQNVSSRSGDAHPAAGTGAAVDRGDRDRPQRFRGDGGAGDHEGVEIEALEVMGINPIRFLIVPRVLAMMVMLPALTVFGDWVGMVGGWSICKYALHFDTANYIYHCINRAEPWDFYSGLVKSVVFAWLTITIACHMGLSVEGGAEGVGQATTGFGGLVAVDHAHCECAC